ncbi:MAG TPA: PAS domain-containing sensor histidine kinase [Aromatoleum sp.]|uniref:sensor histidine kinase n=1 Tax=Aromatoleum sp. TaxID=2307007 RepID=UPI002B4917D1|nr:PAS domain-containing sensor histidine kinase [Aromatoleum sp.]HJV24966.1 PAS domain-containing sensor histidine kinase [Aromatoleum sp.]
MDLLVDDFDAARWVPLRYLNFFRLIIAGLFLVAGIELNLGADAPRVFKGAAIAYIAAVLTLGFPDAARRLGLDRLITLQVVIDIVLLGLIMWASGGYASGMPVLMMVILAGAGLVAKERMVLFYAALATVTVLTENVWRLLSNGKPADFLQVGILCTGFFGIAITARLLARRAKANESLAVQRGEALAKQQAVNERIIRDMQDGVVVLDGEGRVLQANPRAAELLGVLSLEGLRLSDLDENLADLRNACGAEGRLLRAGAAGKLLRCRALGAHDDERDDERDDGTETLVYLTDYEEIQTQIQQLKLAALGRLTASMAHEIRNPLSAVTQAAELLTEEKRGEVQVRLIRIINDNARRIERMIRDVLALGRREDMLPEALPLDVFASGLVDERALGGGSEREIYRFDLPHGATLAIDRAHLHQILDNLLANARRYCSGQPGSVRVFAANETGGRTALHVVDDGPGIPETDRSRIFEPFFTTHPKGTGLGLYIARELADANGATLELLDNSPGAHFVLTGRSLP